MSEPATMRVLLDDAIVTSQVVVPLRYGWVTVPDGAEPRPGLTAADVGPQDIALIPAGEAPALAGTHRLEPGVAVVCGNAGTIAMRSPVRPDEIEETAVRLYHTSRTAELLIRALLRPFFGITASTFITDPAAADAQIVVIEGAEALNAPEAGYQEDLARAWFILTGLHLVSHVLVAPLERTDDAVARVVEGLRAAVGAGVERRKEVRVAVAETAEVDRERLVEITNGLRFELEVADVESLEQLIARGSWGTSYGRELPPLIRPGAG